MSFEWLIITPYAYVVIEYAKVLAALSTGIATFDLLKSNRRSRLWSTNMVFSTCCAGLVTIYYLLMIRYFSSTAQVVFAPFSTGFVCAVWIALESLIQRADAAIERHKRKAYAHDT
jgi:hypothetical protein